MCLPLKHLEENRLTKGEHLGFEWEIVHNGIGGRCGYIRVLPGHPWFEKDYSCSSDEHWDKKPHECNALPDDVHCHGGVTFAAHGKACPTHDEADEWWIGFDTSHSGDAPDLSLPWEHEKKERDREHVETMIGYGSTVKDTEYVKRECLSLCEQAARALIHA